MSLESGFMRALANVQPIFYREVIYKVHAVIWGLLLLSDPGSLHSLLTLCHSVATIQLRGAVWGFLWVPQILSLLREERRLYTLNTWKLDVDLAWSPDLLPPPPASLNSVSGLRVHGSKPQEKESHLQIAESLRNFRHLQWQKGL